MLFETDDTTVNLDGWPAPVAFLNDPEPFAGFSRFLVDALNNHAVKLAGTDVFRQAIADFYPHRNQMPVLREIIRQLLTVARGL